MNTKGLAIIVRGALFWVLHCRDPESKITVLSGGGTTLAKNTSKSQLTLPKEIEGNFPGIDLFDATVEKRMSNTTDW